MKECFPNGNQRVITLVPVGAIDEDFMEIIREYTKIFFFGMEVEIAEQLDVTQFRLRPRLCLPQLKTVDVFPSLHNYRRDDQYCVLGVTMYDLYPQDNWNFVYGEVEISEKVGLFSMCRHVDKWWNYNSYSEIQISDFDETAYKDFLLLSLDTVAHEIGHIFGLMHCIYFQCMMNGVNNEEERDRSPAILCPICQKKLAAAINLELKCYKPIVRCYQLIEFFKKYGGVRQVEILQSVIDMVENYETQSEN